jgi:hypothetical protein
MSYEKFTFKDASKDFRNAGSELSPQNQETVAKGIAEILYAPGCYLRIIILIIVLLVTLYERHERKRIARSRDFSNVSSIQELLDRVDKRDWVNLDAALEKAEALDPLNSEIRSLCKDLANNEEEFLLANKGYQYLLRFYPDEKELWRELAGARHRTIAILSRSQFATTESRKLYQQILARRGGTSHPTQASPRSDPIPLRPVGNSAAKSHRARGVDEVLEKLSASPPRNDEFLEDLAEKLPKGVWDGDDGKEARKFLWRAQCSIIQASEADYSKLSPVLLSLARLNSGCIPAIKDIASLADPTRYAQLTKDLSKIQGELLKSDRAETESADEISFVERRQFKTLDGTHCVEQSDSYALAPKLAPDEFERLAAWLSWQFDPIYSQSLLDLYNSLNEQRQASLLSTFYESMMSSRPGTDGFLTLLTANPDCVYNEYFFQHVPLHISSRSTDRLIQSLLGRNTLIKKGALILALKALRIRHAPFVIELLGFAERDPDSRLILKELFVDYAGVESYRSWLYELVKLIGEHRGDALQRATVDELLATSGGKK